MYCEKCGAPVVEKAKFCSKCGHPVSNPAAQNGTSDLIKQPKKTMDKKRKFVLTLFDMLCGRSPYWGYCHLYRH